MIKDIGKRCGWAATVVGALLVAVGCRQERPRAGAHTFPYLLDQPLAVRTLPAKLREVSGATIDREGQIYLVQDERGVRYVYDWSRDAVTAQVPWAEDGDFEGIAHGVLPSGESAYWMLRSDGLLYAAFAERPSYSEWLDVGYLADWEGLGYDDGRGILWAVGKETARADAQYLYAVSPTQLRIERQVTITQAALRRYCARNGAPCDWSGDTYPLSPSGVAVHPVTGHIYVLAARERALLVVDRTGEVLFLGQFARQLLPQAEGIAFFPNGDLLIASEGEKTGTLVRYAYRALQ